MQGYQISYEILDLLTDEQKKKISEAITEKIISDIQKMEQIITERDIKDIINNVLEVGEDLGLDYRAIGKSMTEMILSVFSIKKKKKEQKRFCKIEGSEILFEMIVPEDTIKEVANNIWDNPEEYYNCKKGKNAYLKFLKYLWIIFPNGRKIRLTEFVNKGG